MNLLEVNLVLLDVNLFYVNEKEQIRKRRREKTNKNMNHLVSLVHVKKQIRMNNDDEFREKFGIQRNLMQEFKYHDTK